jgi:DNA-binding MarR family transcriptional regulator
MRKTGQAAGDTTTPAVHQRGRTLDQPVAAAELAAAFTELGPAWNRWITTCTPPASVSYSRLRLLRVLDQDGARTMSQLACALNVAARRTTSLAMALAEDGLVERRPNPNDRRSTVISLTTLGRDHLRLTWRQFHTDVAAVFGDLSEEQQGQLLDIAVALTRALRRRTSARTAATSTAWPSKGSGHDHHG